MEQKKLQGSQTSLEDSLDDYFGEVLNQTIQGEQKKEFLNTLSDLGISNIVAHDEIAKQVAKAKEKK